MHTAPSQPTTVCVPRCQHTYPYSEHARAALLPVKASTAYGASTRLQLRVVAHLRRRIATAPQDTLRICTFEVQGLRRRGSALTRESG